MSLRQLSGRVGVRIAPDALAEALSAVGPRADAPLDSRDFEGVGKLVDQLVRNLRALSTAETQEVGRALLRGAETSPEGAPKRLPLSTAIDAIRARSYLRAVCVWAGCAWESAMRIQAAAAGVARVVTGQPGATIEVGLAAGTLRVAVETSRAGILSLSDPELAAACATAQSHSLTDAGEWFRLELRFATKG